MTTINMATDVPNFTTLEALVVWANLAYRSCNPTAVFKPDAASTSYRTLWNTGENADRKPESVHQSIVQLEPDYETQSNPVWENVLQTSTTPLPLAFKP